MKLQKSLISILISSAILSACGGGGGSDDTSKSNQNNNTSNTSSPSVPASGTTSTDNTNNNTNNTTTGNTTNNTGSTTDNTSSSTTTGSTTTTTDTGSSGATTTNTITMPLEVMSATSGAVVSVKTNILHGSSMKTLTMKVNNLSYDNKGSVQINNGAWINLANSTVSVLGNAKVYGGIGGGYDTISLTVPVTGGVDGQNTINFRFNTTDGVSSGYRVLSFNLLDSSGSNLIDTSLFVEDDPTKWVAPLANSADVAAGKTLWQSATLIDSPINAGHTLKAHCMDCHAANGSDLYKFNYSNNAIIVRSQYHGLTENQGEQIASYIRNLSTTLPVPGDKCRPWNPPYQPGPGLDSKPVSDWTCGAGLEAISENDLDTLNYVFPNGVNKAAVSTKGQINLREIPIGFQLPDWNHWVPHIHPKDAWGDYFTNSYLNGRYAGEGTVSDYNMRSRLTTGGDSYARGLSGDIFSDMYYWGVAYGEQFSPPGMGTSGQYTIDQQKNIYGTVQWQLMKMWEITQDFNLETTCPVAWVNEEKAPKPEARGWCNYWRFVFNVSPHILQFPPDNSMFGSAVGHYTKANQWYYLQILLNPGSGAHNVHLPTDWQYAYGLVTDLSNNSGRMEPMRNFLYVLKGAQEMDNGVGVTNVDRGWTIRDSSPLDVWKYGQKGIWAGVSPTTEQAVVNAFLSNWMDTTTSFDINTWQRAGAANAESTDLTCGWSMRQLCETSYVHGTVSGGTVENFPTWTWNQIPLMQTDGLSNTETNRLADWLNTAYPSGNYLTLKK